LEINTRGNGLPVNDAMWVLALVFALGGGWMDWRSRRLPNWWTVSGLVVGLALNAVLLGWPGAKHALAGAGLGLLVLLPFVWLRAMGAGDWKLMGALGALLGPGQLLFLLWAAAITAGVMAVIEAFRRKRVRSTLVNVGRLLYTFVTLGRRGGAHRDVSLDNPQATTVPFGVAVAVATVICFSGRLLARG
jgi:prepilin peptidase CpaA